MDMNTAAVFLGGSILYALGMLIILAAIILANNMIHKYWKSYGWKFFPAFIEKEEKNNRV
jgi:cytochrome b561